jgi:hypothetical protein
MIRNRALILETCRSQVRDAAFGGGKTGTGALSFPFSRAFLTADGKQSRFC